MRRSRLFPLAWLRGTGADPPRLNVNDGGGIPLGHPQGASGTKLLTTLIHAPRARSKRYSLPTLCKGSVVNATIVEAL